MDKIKLAQRTIALLSSMIHSGEQHTARSKEMVDNALKGLEELKNCSIPDVVAMLPTHGLHKSLGKIEIFGVRVKSNYSNNLMYMTIIDGEMLWVYDYEIKLG